MCHTNRATELFTSHSAELRTNSEGVLARYSSSLKSLHKSSIEQRQETCYLPRVLGMRNPSGMFASQSRS
jgi:hypothetical protein